MHRRHAEQEYARLIETLIYFQRDDVARLDIPIVEPHAQPRISESFSKPSHTGLVFRVVT